ncbi:MAG: hypothetical protein R3C14_42295 [Caldilineaceae bacterium]
MGHSPSIADLEKQDAEFSDYIKSATDNLNERAKPEEEDFHKMIESYYSQNKWDNQPICEGSNTDYRQTAEFSLDSIHESLQNVANSVFMGGAPPDGVHILQDFKAVAKIAVEMADFQVLALSAATAFITQILGAFTTTVSTEYHSNMASRSIAPGLVLHAWCYGDAFQRKDYFNNQFIIENVVDFNLTYSFAQAEMQQDIAYMDAHTQEIADLDEKIIEMQKNVDDWAMDPNKDFEETQKYQDRITFLKERLEEYRKEVDKLVEKYKKEGKS